MTEKAAWSGEMCPPDELERRAGELARAWAVSNSDGGEPTAHDIERAESVIRWLSGVVSDGPANVDMVTARVDELSQMIVHELKNPLAQVQVGLDMLAKRSVDGDEERMYLGWIERGVARAVEVLDDVRLLGVTEATQGERWLPVRTVVTTVLARVDEQARSAGVECSVEGELPDGLIDGAQVGMALGNLVANAVKYSDAGKLERWVRVRVERVVGIVEGLRFTVADNGLGIPARLQREVFRQNFRAHPEVSAGMGLGLAITRRVIERRRGQIWFHSEEGTGSVFHFVVPERVDRPPAPTLAELR